MNNFILHIPHSSTYIPFYGGYLHSQESLKEEMNLLTDWFTDELYDLPYQKIIAPFSRIFCDVERFADDSQEVMSRLGMGMCYTDFDSREPMRIVSPELKARIKSEYYDKHHEMLEKACLEALKQYEKVLVIDCHSFPEEPFNRDLNKHIPRPDFCIGTDEFHTPRELVASAFTFLNHKGFSVLENDPYSGTLIPMKYYRQNKNVNGIMIEVNRKLYMEENNGKIFKSIGFNTIRSVLAELIMHISQIAALWLLFIL